MGDAFLEDLMKGCWVNAVEDRPERLHEIFLFLAHQRHVVVRQEL